MYCKFCPSIIQYDGIVWVDETEGDVCCGENNDTERHQPLV